MRGLESLTQLRWLSLSVNTLTRKMTEQVLGLPQLARLDLYLHASEAGAIAALAKAPALRALAVDIPDNQHPLAELGRLEQVRYLWVVHPDGIKPDLISLREALPACRVFDGWRYREADDYDWSG